MLNPPVIGLAEKSSASKGNVALLQDLEPLRSVSIRFEYSNLGAVSVSKSHISQ